jgi:hypothetical protein
LENTGTYEKSRSIMTNKDNIIDFQSQRAKRLSISTPSDFVIMMNSVRQTLETCPDPVARERMLSAWHQLKTAIVETAQQHNKEK